MSEKSLRSKVIRLAHQKPELRDHLLPLIKKEGGNVKIKVTEGQPAIRYRIDNRFIGRTRLSAIFHYRVVKKSVVTQKLISDLNEFEKQCFSMTKSLERVFKTKDLGKLIHAGSSVVVSLDTDYPLLGTYDTFWDIGNDKVNDVRLILESLGATEWVLGGK